MTIKTRFIFLMLIPAGILFLLAGVSVISYIDVDRNFTEIKWSIEQYSTVSNISTSIHRQIQEYFDYTLEGKDSVHQKHLNDMIKSTQRGFEQWNSLISRSNDESTVNSSKKLYSNLKIQYDSLLSQTRTLVEKVDQSKQDEALKYLREHLIPVIDYSISQDLDSFLARTKEDTESQLNRVYSRLSIYSLSTACLSMLFFVYIIFVVFLFIKRTLYPVLAIDGLLSKIESGGTVKIDSHRFAPEIRHIIDSIGALSVRLTDLKSEAKHAEHEIDVLFAQFSDPVVVLDKDSRIIHLNTSAQALLGVSFPSVSARPYSSIFGQEHPSPQTLIHSETVNSVKCDVREDPNPIRITLLSKSKRFVSVRSIAFFDKDGSSRGQVVILKDMEELLESRNEHALMMKMLDHVSSSVIITDLNCSIKFVNQSFCNLCGYSWDDTIKRKLNFLKPLGDGPQPFDRFIEAFSAAKEWRGEFVIRCNDGEEKRVVASVIPVKDMQSEDFNVVAILDDISTFKRVETELQEVLKTAESSRRRKNIFFSRIKDEIVTPLDGVVKLSESLLKDEGGDRSKFTEESTRQILDSSFRVMHFANDILAVVSLESGKMELQFDRFDLGKMCADCLLALKPATESRKLEIAYDFDDETIELNADKRAISHIILNILDNTVRLAGVEMIGFSVRFVNNNAVLTIALSGTPSFGSDIIPKITEEFGSSPGQSDFPVFWLGLFVAKKLVELHRGSVSAVPGTIPHSVIITVRLPGASISSASTGAKSFSQKGEALVKSDAPLILIIDRNKELQTALSSTFDGFRYQFMTVEYTTHVLQNIWDLHPAMLILNMSANKRNAVETFLKLKEVKSTKSIPLIIVDHLEGVAVSYSVGDVEYLEKPLRRDILRLKIETMIGLKPSYEIAIIDDSSDSRQLLKKHLNDPIYSVMEFGNVLAASTAIIKTPPDLVLLDVIMPGSAGIGLFLTLNRLSSDRRPKVIITGDLDFDDDDVKILEEYEKNSVDASKNPKDDLLASIMRCLSTLKK